MALCFIVKVRLFKKFKTLQINCQVNIALVGSTNIHGKGVKFSFIPSQVMLLC